MTKFIQKAKQPKATWTRVVGAVPVRSAAKRTAVPKPPRSKAMSRRMAVYAPIRGHFLKCHPECEVVWFGAICRNRSEDVHHTRGRLGNLLFDMRWFLPVCRACHVKIGNRYADAVKNGCVASKGQWNVPCNDSVKDADFYVAIPNAAHTAISGSVCVTVPVRWDGMHWIMTSEAHKTIDMVKRAAMEK